MVPDVRKPAARAAFGMSSPSSHDAWCGSPHAICTTLTPSWSMRRFNSGMFFTCSDQLHTPTSSMIFSCEAACGSGGGFERHTEGSQVAVAALLVQTGHLLGLQFRDFLRPSPDDGTTLFVGGHHQRERFFEF